MFLAFVSISYSQETIDTVSRYRAVRVQVNNDDYSNCFEKILDHSFSLAFKNQPFDKTYLFMIGISEYEYLPELPKVTDDLKSIQEAMVRVAGVDEIIFLKNEYATEESIRYFMDSYFRKKLKSNDRLIFYFSGHGDTAGGATSYMLLGKAIADEFYHDAVPLSMIREWAAYLPAKHILFLIDSCVSGYGFEPHKGNQSSDEGLLNALGGAGSRHVITAGSGQETISDGWFTEAISIALKKQNSKFFTSFDFYSNIYDYLTIKAANQGLSVHPQMFNLDYKKNGSFIFTNALSNSDLPLYIEPYIKNRSQKSIKFTKNKYSLQSIIGDRIPLVVKYVYDSTYINSSSNVLSIDALRRKIHSSSKFWIVPKGLDLDIMPSLDKHLIVTYTFGTKRVAASHGYTKARLDLSYSYSIVSYDRGEPQEDLRSPVEIGSGSTEQKLAALFEKTVFDIIALTYSDVNNAIIVKPGQISIPSNPANSWGKGDVISVLNRSEERSFFRVHKFTNNQIILNRISGSIKGIKPQSYVKTTSSPKVFSEIGVQYNLITAKINGEAYSLLPSGRLNLAFEVMRKGVIYPSFDVGISYMEDNNKVSGTLYDGSLNLIFSSRRSRFRGVLSCGIVGLSLSQQKADDFISYIPDSIRTLEDYVDNSNISSVNSKPTFFGGCTILYDLLENQKVKLYLRSSFSTNITVSEWNEQYSIENGRNERATSFRQRIPADNLNVQSVTLNPIIFNLGFLFRIS